MNARTCGRASPHSAQKNQFTEKNRLHHPQSSSMHKPVSYIASRKKPEKNGTNENFIEKKKCLTVAEMRKKAFEFITLRTHTHTQFSPANDNDDSAFLSLYVANMKINSFIRTHKTCDAQHTRTFLSPTFPTCIDMLMHAPCTLYSKPTTSHSHPRQR